MHKLNTLSPGGGIGVVALGSPLIAERFELAKQTVEGLGYTLHYPLHPSTYYGKLASGFANGSKHERLDAFNQLLRDPAVEVIVSARGGYGILDLFTELDWHLIQAARKPIVGLSDTTALLVQAGSRLSIPTIHGPSFGDLFADYAVKPEARHSVDGLLRLLSDPDYRYQTQCSVLRAGSGRGLVLGGNLTMLTCLLGTAFEPDFEGKILILEEVGEAPYRIHRMFSHLKLAGKLDRLAGLVFGRFAKCESANPPGLAEVFQMLVDDMLAASSYPVISGLPFGHWGEHQAIALGCGAEIEGQNFRVTESPIQ